MFESGAMLVSRGLRVRDTGEFDLIELLASQLPDRVRDHIDSGIGDDAAVIDMLSGTQLVATTDAMVDGVHFRLDWTDWKSLGHKLMAVNLSDLAAMGATPTAALVTLGLTGDELVDDLVQMYQGMATLASRFDVTIAGGDVVKSPNALTLNLTAFGRVERGRAIRRSGAKIGDLVCVSGSLGASATGMRLLQKPELHATTRDQLVHAHLRPAPRIDLGRLLASKGVTAAMDLSDGLFGDLPKLLAASGVAAEIHRDRIPIPAAVHALFPEDWFELGTRGGEDYELLTTVPEAYVQDFIHAASHVGTTISVIGTVVEGEPGTILLDGELVHPEAFDHFK